MIQGTLHPDFWPVARELDRQVPEAGGGGAAVCVYHRGAEVVDVWKGARDANGAPWQADTMALSFSTTKGVVSTALHLLVERGAVDYDDPVAKHWPEFAQAGKERITLRHLLCHESGLYPVRSLVDHARRLLDWDFMVERLAAAAPAFEPGTANGYQALTYGHLVGEVVRRVGGRSLGAFVREELAEPLGLDGLFIGVPEAELGRVATLARPSRFGPPRSPLRRIATLAVARGLSTVGYPVDPRRSLEALAPSGVEDVLYGREILSAEVPAANGVFTARSLARLYALLAGGGVLDEVRLLSPDTVRLAGAVQNRRVDLVVPFPMHWRLGYHRVPTARGDLRRAFGHFGFGGSGAWADPERNLAVAMVCNTTGGTPFGDLRLLRLNAAAARCADRR